MAKLSYDEKGIVDFYIVSALPKQTYPTCILLQKV